MDSGRDALAQFELWMQIPVGSLAREGWHAHPVVRDGEYAAIGVMRGTELHFAVAPHWRGRILRRSAIREYLEPLFEQYGFLTTRVMRGYDAGRRFVERLGFKRTRSDATIDYFMLSDLPYAAD